MNPFENIIPKLPDSTVQSIQNVMLDACIAYELGADYRSVLRKARYKSIGAQRKAIEHLVNNATDVAMERLSVTMMTHF